jgi:cell division septation protein DedD
MPRNETGEFELVLGNRQLLSGFAVVAILFGVFFAMGYIVGRNSTPSARLLASEGPQSASGGTAGQPDPGRTQNQPTGQQTAASAPDVSAANPAHPPVAAEVTPQPPRPPERTAKPVEKPPEAAPAVQNAESLQTGTYLQVIATIKTDAEVISKSLQDRRFPAIITPSSLEGRFRVLVGPYKDATALGGAKTELENLGFHPIAVKIAERN